MDMNIDMARSNRPELPSTPDESYPSFYYDGPESIDLPESGEMTIRFKRASEQLGTHDGKTHYSCCIEVVKIVSVEADEEDDAAPSKSYGKDSEDALDRLAKAKSKSKEKE